MALSLPSSQSSQWRSIFVISAVLSITVAAAFQSDELLVDDEEFGLEGGLHTKSPDLTYTKSTPPPASPTTSPTRKRFSDPDSDSKIQFQLHHAFGDSDFSPAGTFSARLKMWNHGGQTLTKLQFSRNAFTEEELEDEVRELRDELGFYKHKLEMHLVESSAEDTTIEEKLLDSVLATLINKDEAVSARAFLEANKGNESCGRLLKMRKCLKPSSQKVLSLVAELLLLPPWETRFFFKVGTALRTSRSSRPATFVTPSSPPPGFQAQA